MSEDSKKATQITNHVSVQLKSPIEIPNFIGGKDSFHTKTLSNRQNIPMSNRMLVFKLDDIIPKTEYGIPETLNVETLFCHPVSGEVLEKGEIRIPKENIKAVIQSPQSDAF
ncbi:hypothetical protein [Melghirimyces algeriensis]|uniref:Uncharacterized protein n=1 Tax=Melghirimyces algeriensis TaxID=910412 RepID=A0A521F7V2_9BACL|nr:hypothetical protein [Melghirimyces algeriensis]SMO92217.1 hypothetical protein SAMN06264849_11441 [Melghirimyces algeriensis]